MNDTQENRMNMFLSTQLVMQENAAKWNTVPALVQGMGELDANIGSLKTAMMTQTKDATGLHCGQA